MTREPRQRSFRAGMIQLPFHALRVLYAASMLLCVSANAQAPGPLTVVIHTEDARAVLTAMQNPSLTQEQAETIAAMHGNQAILQKLHEFHIPATTADFAGALLAIAQGHAITTPPQKSIFLYLVQPKAAQLSLLLSQMEADPAHFQQWIESKIATYAPADSHLHLNGYVVAGGDGGGYTFGDTDFFLNIGFTDDLILARNVTTHEMYHAVQGAFADRRKTTFPDAKALPESACSNVERLFEDLYEEGSATAVADPSELRESHSPGAARILQDTQDGLKHLDWSSTLLEMSVLSLQGRQPPAFDDVYAVGFLGHGELYNIGYAMARSIVEADGPSGLARFLQQPPHRFLLRYAALPAYGKDKDHPALGANTLAAATLLNNGCR